MLGGLYQSVLRAELSHRLGVDWRPIVNGQAEIAGVPDELLGVFSKRTADIDEVLADELDDFRQREGREPSRWERAALTREASADTRSHKSGNGAERHHVLHALAGLDSSERGRAFSDVGQDNASGRRDG